MKTDSMMVKRVSMEALVKALKSKYSDSVKVDSLSGDTRLLVVEKYYFMNNSHAAGVVLIEPF
jgi:hypothetical protein